MDKYYKQILVPLDGSQFAELALVDAFSQAKFNQAEVTLLQVIPPIKDFFTADTDYPIFIVEQWQANRELALQYLKTVCERVDCESIVVRAVIETGPVAETIIDYAHQHSIDLIVMASHGHSGLQRWPYGSVAGKVLSGSGLSTLLVRGYPNRGTTT